MKKLFIVIILFSFVGCKKCATCTRTWKYKSYSTNASHTTHTNETTTDGGTEIFEVCTGNDIHDAEKTVTTKAEVKSSAGFIVTEGTGTCSCDTK